MANVLHGSGELSRYGTTVFASAARTTTPDTHEFEIGSGWESLTLVVDTTAAGTSPDTTVKVEWVDRASGSVFPSGTYTTASITGVGTVTLRVSPHLTASGTTIYTDVIHPVVRITATHGNATSHTYSVGMLLA